ncbi:Uncharacterised protein [Yersinia frederiksenii]|uniref:Uncharacterized protein n=2 Tax=Yersinia frederiksenii TaxID=29484 RepID=A0A380Q0P0_YERFR|nr:hypothetical protein [Yersinia frederiksenii]KGA47996.1 hypothetical protein DJ58_3689 [Yersinia frederiksenii ATCC 33641]CNF10382.1 Uncharacterised protein [Yersinia frederiksenii]SUP79358.1 Uncharacterised protein [Yersinia frederiksenii]
MTTPLTTTLTHHLWQSLGYLGLPKDQLVFVGEEQLPSVFPVTPLVCAS